MQTHILQITPTFVGHLQGKQDLSYLIVISMPALYLIGKKKIQQSYHRIFCWKISLYCKNKECLILFSGQISPGKRNLNLKFKRPKDVNFDIKTRKEAN
jgi:hypothetical protein